MNESNGITRVEDYEPLIGGTAVERILGKAEALQPLQVVNVSSSPSGGGVATILDPFTLLLNSTGIETGWRIIQGAPNFFRVTKEMYNALQNGGIDLTERKKRIYEGAAYKNAVRNHLNHHDIVVVHDPQPLPFIQHYRKKGSWIWHAHMDLASANQKLWTYLSSFVEQYDAVVLNLEAYRQQLKTPQRFIPPAIDPFSIKNKKLSEEEIEERLGRYNIPTDLPLVVQISRFDRWKDPQGVIQAFKMARKEVDATLVLLGNTATDDPEGQKVYESLQEQAEDRILILNRSDRTLVNALQRRAAVVLQKSIREGFGLTVTEAMWKEAAVIGGNVGGIRYQIADGENGVLVDSVEETAERIVYLLQHPDQARKMGQKARRTVQSRFLLTRLLEDYLDLFGAFKTMYRPAD